MKFSKNQWVVCVDASGVAKTELTEDVPYCIHDVQGDHVEVITDFGKMAWFHEKRFELAYKALNSEIESAPAPQGTPTVIENEQVYCFDVDDTLVFRDNREFIDDATRVAIKDPYDGVTVFLRHSERHIKLLTQMHGRGRYVIVWSQSGAQWARAVVEALGLESYVHLCMTKPHGYVDDLPANVWLGSRIYLEGDT